MNIDQIKEAVDIVELINEDTILTKKGISYVGHHKKHESDSKTSLVVSPAKNLYHCFNCGEGGSAIDWLMNNRGMNIREALIELSQRTGIPLPDMSEEQRLYQEKLHRDKKDILPILLSAAKFYHSQFTEKHYDEALQRWGINKESIDRKIIGYSPIGGYALKNHLKTLGYSEELLIKTGLFIKLGHKIKDFFEGRLMFPYWFNNQVVYFCYCCLITSSNRQC